MNVAATNSQIEALQSDGIFGPNLRMNQEVYW